MAGLREYTVVLVVLFVIPTAVLGALPFQCYGCTGRYTDDCISNKDIVNCTRGQDTCMMEVINFKSSLQMRYTKMCTTRSACQQAKSRYSKGCHNAEGAICVTCCNTARCNVRPDPTYGPDWVRLSRRSAGVHVSPGGAVVMTVLTVLAMHLVFH
ncbi:PREDICTED: ly6/PLAUR domain-containing protein 1-like [Branchiostoma belcheri]|uniref:Ly6/PLAUR domain-containing protein 1-like n=1 Tax=Branchiostoma belcheri TaxID=7741 RepID=A0A6P4ZQQ9_BRABE|nr:PREDICTED: ly6/PLAUR domain-containing protein 1-like [Branchiostoma belcheri]